MERAVVATVSVNNSGHAAADAWNPPGEVMPFGPRHSLCNLLHFVAGKGRLISGGGPDNSDFTTMLERNQ